MARLSQPTPPERAARADTVRLWRKVRTLEDPVWTKRYHSRDPSQKAFGGRVEIRFSDGRILTDELAVANAHPLGATPWVRKNYLGKFNAITAAQTRAEERGRFLAVAQRLPELSAEDLLALNVVADAVELKNRTRDSAGIF